MRNHLMGWILALLAALALSPVLHAQTAVQAGAATAQAQLPHQTCPGFGSDCEIRSIPPSISTSARMSPR